MIAITSPELRIRRKPTVYGSSRISGAERRRLNRFAAQQAARFDDTPRLVKRTLRVIPMEEFLSTAPVTMPVTDVVAVDVVPASVDAVTHIREA